MPDPVEIKEEEAAHLFYLFFMLPSMVSLRLITQEEADTLHSQLNDKLHDALGLGGAGGAPEPVTEVPAGGVGRYKGSDTTYQEVISWTVSEGKIGELKEVSMAANKYDKAVFKVEVGDKAIMDDDEIPTTLTLSFYDLELDPGTVVKLSAKSLDGTNIVVDGSIVGKEKG